MDYSYDRYIGLYKSTRDFADTIINKQKTTKLETMLEKIIQTDYDAKRAEIEDMLFSGQTARYEAIYNDTDVCIFKIPPLTISKRMI